MRIAATHTPLSPRSLPPPAPVPTCTPIFCRFGTRGQLWPLLLCLTSLVAYLNLAGCCPNPVVAVRERLSSSVVFRPIFRPAPPSTSAPALTVATFPLSVYILCPPAPRTFSFFHYSSQSKSLLDVPLELYQSAFCCCADIAICQLPHPRPHTHFATPHVAYHLLLGPRHACRTSNLHLGQTGQDRAHS